MFEAKRTAKSLDFKFGEKIVKVYLGGLFQYKKFAKADEVVRAKIESLKSTNEKDIDKICADIGFAVMQEMNIIFGEKIADEILSFYDGNYDEMLNGVLPFIQCEYIPAMVENIKAISKSKVEKYE